MNITKKNEKDYVKIILSGEFDIDTDHSKFLDIIEQEVSSGNSILLDLGQVPFICSADISVIVQTRKYAQKYNVKIAICNCQAAVERVFEMTNVKTIMHFFSNESLSKKFFM